MGKLQTAAIKDGKAADRARAQDMCARERSPWLESGVTRDNHKCSDALSHSLPDIKMMNMEADRVCSRPALICSTQTSSEMK